jgi:hypothetical protein
MCDGLSLPSPFPFLSLHENLQWRDSYNSLSTCSYIITYLFKISRIVVLGIIQHLPLFRMLIIHLIDDAP